MSSCSDQVNSQDSSKKLSSFNTFLDAIAQVCIVSAGVLLVLLVAIFGWLVFGRYVLNDTPTWVEQASLVLVVYITFLGAAAGVRNNSHLSIDFIREGLPGLPREIMRYLADIIVIIFGGFMTWQGWLMVVQNIDRPIPIIGLSESWRAAPLVICGALMVLFSSVNIGERIFHPRREKE